MNFSFGFSGEDYIDDIEQDVDAQDTLSLNNLNDNNKKINDAQSKFINPLDDDCLLRAPVIQSQIENYQQFLQSLKDVRLTFEKFYTQETNDVLFRRELLDIKHQLMTEYDTNDDTNDFTTSTNNNWELDILLNEDLKKKSL